MTRKANAFPKRLGGKAEKIVNSAGYSFCSYAIWGGSAVGHFDVIWSLGCLGGAGCVVDNDVSGKRARRRSGWGVSA